MSEYTRAELVEAYFAAKAAASRWSRQAEVDARAARSKAKEASDAAAQLYEVMAACDPVQHREIQAVGDRGRIVFDWNSTGSPGEWRKWAEGKRT